VESLQRRIAPHLLRRVKEDVAKDIPPKEETIIDVELTTMQKQYYRCCVVCCVLCSIYIALTIRILAQQPCPLCLSLALLDTLYRDHLSGTLFTFSFPLYSYAIPPTVHLCPHFHLKTHPTPYHTPIPTSHTIPAPILTEPSSSTITDF
jgi:SNF2-related domain